MKTESPEAGDGDRGVGKSREDELRASLRARFDEWLDEVLAPEAQIAGLDAELLAALQHPADVAQLEKASLHDLWSGLTSLTQEVRLQGRAFQKLDQRFETVTTEERGVKGDIERMTEKMQELRDAILSTPAEEGPAPGVAARDLMDVLLDLVDRLERGLTRARQQAGELHLEGGLQILGWCLTRAGVVDELRRKFEALREGYELGVLRLRDALSGLEIERIPAPGGPFDPAFMQVVDVEVTDRVAEGTVLEVHQHGYLRRGEVLRVARVRVARRPVAT